MHLVKIRLLLRHDMSIACLWSWYQPAKCYYCACVRFTGSSCYWCSFSHNDKHSVKIYQMIDYDT
jgi:hypothetical protein